MQFWFRMRKNILLAMECAALFVVSSAPLEASKAVRGMSAMLQGVGVRSDNIQMLKFGLVLYFRFFWQGGGSLAINSFIQQKINYVS